MKQIITISILVLLILAGIGIILYPTISDYILTLEFNHTIASYQDTLTNTDNIVLEEARNKARDYNQRLMQNTYSLTSLNDAERIEYNSLLNIADTGIMGYIFIPSIDVSLPVYHGTDDQVLQRGVGHIEGSSLPVGGESTHVILSAHSGLPQAKLFTNLDKMEIGDTFSLSILGEVLTYEVYNISIVLPEELEAERIEDGQDYVTLSTCTPYGVNTHRLLVRGRRVPTPDNGYNEIDDTLSKSSIGILLLIASFVFVVFIVLIVIVFRRKIKTKSIQ